MSHSFPVHAFDERTYPLDVIVTPVDDFTSLPVLRGVSARIPAQAATARRTLTGSLVFERLVPKPQYIIEMNPSRAGYFVPPDVKVDMPQDRDTREVRLIRRPEAIRDGETMLVRGAISTQAGGPVAGQPVEGHVANVAEPFRTITDERGNFALRLKPRSPTLNADPRPVPLTADVLLRFPGTGVADHLLDDVKDLQTWAPPVAVVIP